jgi:drug/metabolite transporter (DMT)-like permease
MEHKPSSPVMIIVAFATVYIVWGSTYFFIQMAMQSIPPLLIGALRFSTAGLLLLGWCVLKGEKIIDRKSLISSAIAGSLMLAGGNGAVVLGEKTLPSAVVAILWCSQPLIFVLMDKNNWRINFQSGATIVGLLIGFAGVCMLFWEHLFNYTGASFQVGSMLLVIGGTIAFSAGSLYSKTHPPKVSAAVNVAWQMIAAAVIFFVGSLMRHELTRFSFDQVTIQAWLAIAYLVLFGSIAAFTAYVWLLANRPATQVSTYAYVNPVIAVILGILFANEHITVLQIGGLVVILISVMLINLSRYQVYSGKRVMLKECR